jgi:hypothetical protein
VLLGKWSKVLGNVDVDKKALVAHIIVDSVVMDFKFGVKVWIRNGDQANRRALQLSQRSI